MWRSGEVLRHSEQESGYFGYRVLEGKTGGVLLKAIRQRLGWLQGWFKQKIEEQTRERVKLKRGLWR